MRRLVTLRDLAESAHRKGWDHPADYCSLCRPLDRAVLAAGINRVHHASDTHVGSEKEES